MPDKNRIIKLLIFLCALFISVIIYLNVYYFIKGDSLKNLSYNRRSISAENRIKRGSIYDRNGQILAYTEVAGGNRKYNYPKTYSHIIGYSSREYGKSALEREYNQTLLGIDGLGLDDLLKVRDNKEGKSIKLTIDHELQYYARERLLKKKGSIIAMDVKTGEILAMASYPDFNPEDLVNSWKDIVERTDSPLLNRSTQGLYEPGSVFKVITSNALIGKIDINEKYNSTGREKIDGYEFRDANRGGYGDIDLKAAFVNSSNTYFTNRVQKISSSELGKSADEFFFNKDIPFDLPVKKSIFDYSNLSKVELSASAIGQGKILTTPMNMVLVASLIANDGDFVQPILVKSIINPNGKEEIRRPVKKTTGLNANNMNIITDMMVETVEKGTGKSARIKGVNVAGKTGTAEKSKGKTNAWFIGFAPAEDPQVVVCVLIEDSKSSGGVEAAPIARNIIERALKIK